MTTKTEAMSHTTIEDRRALKWIEPGFQKRYAFLLMSIVLLVGTVLIGTFWYHADQVLRTLEMAGVLKQHSLYVLISQQMGSLLMTVWIVVGLFCAFIMLAAYFLSHRIVGPLFAIKRSLERIGRGELSEARIQLRADDEFQDVGQMVNRVVEQLESKR